MTYRLSIYRHFWKISISISISIWSYLKISISISISIRQFCKISISIKYRINSNLAYRTGLAGTQRKYSFSYSFGGGGQVKVDLSYAHCESLQLLPSGLVCLCETPLQAGVAWGLDVGLHFNGGLLIFLAEKGADRGLAVSTRASKLGRIKSSIS